MDQGRESDEFASWIESRRLIISQLSAMDGSIRDLAVKIDKFNDSAREKAIDVAREAQSGIADLNLRVAMLELRAKMWGAVGKTDYSDGFHVQLANPAGGDHWAQ